MIIKPFLLLGLDRVKNDTLAAASERCANLCQSISTIVQTRTHLPLTLFFPFASIGFLATAPMHHLAKRGNGCLRGVSGEF